ncbi:hypothetical protein L1049_000872 [Liquidambar formosana]|uniref:Fe2OG dioxygenase domain-containing protein n=1 Tax=Liquidambar formosana TaxID=63359 RepID=A0AAP0N9J7_LIQFO
MGSKIPTIEFGKGNLKPGSSDWNRVRNEVRKALEEYGCFEAVYDNSVTMELDDAIFGVAKDLFNLPKETKRLNVNNPDRPSLGYLGDFPDAPHTELTGIYDALVFENIQSFTNLMWPQGNASFSEIMYSYTTFVADMEKMVNRMVFESMGVEKYYNSHVESTEYVLRFLKYEAPGTNEKTLLGVGSHTDKSFLTILHQNQVNGLEVQTKHGEWIQLTPAASSFIVMVGDLFYAWSNGRLHCPRHRAVISGNESRYSMGLFSFSKMLTQAPEELVDEQHPLLFKPFDCMGLLKFTVCTEEGQKAESPLKAYCGV